MIESTLSFRGPGIAALATSGVGIYAAGFADVSEFLRILLLVCAIVIALIGYGIERLHTSRATTADKEEVSDTKIESEKNISESSN